MGCVQSKAAAPIPEVLPSSIKVSSSTKTAVAPAHPGQPSQIGDPIYLDRADTLAPQDPSSTFRIQAEGNQGLQEYVEDVKASNRPNGKPPTSATKLPPLSASSLAANSPFTPPDSQLTMAESLSTSLSLAQAQAQRNSSEQRVSLEDRGGKVTLPPLPPGSHPRKSAASLTSVNVQVIDRPDPDLPSSSSFTQQQLNSLPGSTGVPADPTIVNSLAAPAGAVPSSPAEPDAESESPNLQPQPSTGSKTFKQMNAGKPKVTKRAQFGSMYMGAGAHNSINRPTYAQDAVDEDNADAKMSGIFAARDQAVSPVQQRRYEAFSSMVFAQGGVPVKHVTANDMPSPDTDVQRNDLAPDASLDLSEGGQDMGSLTGWQALANEIMMEGEEEEAEAGGLDREESRDMGSLTGWQALANEVMNELGSGRQAANPQPDDSEEPLQAWNNGTFKMDASHAAVKPVGVARPAAKGLAPKQDSWAASTAAPNAKKGGTFYIQYETLEELGEGAFGKAMKCRRRRDNQVFVVKIMHESKMSAKAIEEAKNEVKVLNSLNHPNIVKYYECYQERNMMHIIMEFCQEGDLDSAIKKYKGYLPEEDIMLKFVQIALALHYTHSKGIIHRDLKANNIFCSAHGIVKLGDFGISKALGDNQNVARTMVGTPYYMSPEILKGKPYDGKTDVWAIGCVLYEMCALKKAFDASNLGAITVKVMSGKFPPIPAHYSNDLKELVEALIKKEPEARPSLQEILDLAYVRRHMQAYRDHISRHITERQTSFQRSLSQFNLESIAQEAVTDPTAAVQSLADRQAASLDQLQDNLQGPSAAERDGSATAGPSHMDKPRAPGGGGRARRKSGIIMSELGANLKPLPPSAASAAAEAARAAAERRGAEAAQRQAHRLELRKQEEAQALTNLRAFKDSIKAAVSKVGSAASSAIPSPSSSGGSTTLVTPIASATGSATAARRSRFGGRSQSVESITALDSVVPDAVLAAGRANRFSMFNSAALRGNKEETADDEDATPADRTDSLAQLQQKVPNLMAQMNGISQNPTTSQI